MRIHDESKRAIVSMDLCSLKKAIQWTFPQFDDVIEIVEGPKDRTEVAAGFGLVEINWPRLCERKSLEEKFEDYKLRNRKGIIEDIILGCMVMPDHTNKTNAKDVNLKMEDVQAFMSKSERIAQVVEKIEADYQKISLHEETIVFYWEDGVWKTKNV